MVWFTVHKTYGSLYKVIGIRTRAIQCTRLSTHKYTVQEVGARGTDTRRSPGVQ